MALSPDLKSTWLPLPRTTTVVLIEDFQGQHHTQRRRRPALPTQDLFPPANLNSHHEKTLGGQKFIQLLLVSILLSKAKSTDPGLWLSQEFLISREMK